MMQAFVDYKRRRAVEPSWLLPDSRAAWFLKVCGAVLLGFCAAALGVWLK